jgi:hypothetical protein
MTVQKLIEELQKLDPNESVYMDNDKVVAVIVMDIWDNNGVTKTIQLVPQM